jgi:hypothetical protein
VSLLREHHRRGRRFEATELVEGGSSIAVRLLVSDPRWEGQGEAYKVVLFDETSGKAVLLQDCVDRDDALARLS